METPKKVIRPSAPKGLPKHSHHHAATSKGRGLLIIVCVLIGYIAGCTTKSSLMFTTSFMNSLSSNNDDDDGQRQDIMTASVAANHNNNNNTPSNVIEEIIPPSLLPSYSSENLLFPVSRSMLRKSRPIIGNTDRLHTYIQKLRDGICTTVLFIGGSVTEGHNGGGVNNAYPKHFMDWLNEKYPCKKPINSSSSSTNTTTTPLTPQNKNEGPMHIYLKTPASISNSETHFGHMNSITSLGNIDIIFIEFNVGDAFQKDVPHALENKGVNGMTKEYASCWYFEAFIRRLLLIRQPDPVAIVTFNADYMGLIWHPSHSASYQPPKPSFDPANARKELFRSNIEPINVWLSSMYGIPVFSVVSWLLPMAGQKGTMQQFNDSYPYSTKNWHADSCCHPRRFGGHHVLALIIAYCLVEEEKIMVSSKEVDRHFEEQDYTMHDPPLLRDALYLSPEEDELYVKNNSTSVLLDFTNPNGEEKWKSSIISNNNFTWYADNKDKDKFGLTADGVAGGQHLAIELMGEEHGHVDISYVVSYENFGVCLAWLGDVADNTKQSECNEVPKGRGGPQRLSGIWAYKGERVSVPKVDLLTERLPKGEKKYLHICLTPRSNDQQGPGNKFKLLSVRTY